jgi:hypothetical protein
MTVISSADARRGSQPRQSKREGRPTVDEARNVALHTRVKDLALAILESVVVLAALVDGLNARVVLGERDDLRTGRQADKSSQPGVSAWREADRQPTSPR